jgi:thiol-disulfide isomerase/thioredoxin
LEGRPHRLSTYRGKVVFLNVWATWCPPCREEMPHLIELYREYRDRGFVLLALSDKVNDTVEAQRRFAQVYNVPFPLLMVESLSQLPKPYSLVSVFPTTFLIRADGTLAVVKGGVLSKEEGETLLRLLLEERKGPSSASSPSS